MSGAAIAPDKSGAYDSSAEPAVMVRTSRLLGDLEQRLVPMRRERSAPVRSRRPWSTVSGARLDAPDSRLPIPDSRRVEAR
jgi:hypothetical protein